MPGVGEGYDVGSYCYISGSPCRPKIVRNYLIVYRGVDKACEVFMRHEKDPKIVHPTVDHIWAYGKRGGENCPQDL